MKKNLIKLAVTFIMLSIFAIISMSTIQFSVTPSFQTVDTKTSFKSENSKSNYHNDTSVDSSESGISDTYGFFDEDELDSLTMLVQNKAEEFDMNIFIFIAGESYRNFSDYRTECFSDDTYDEMYGEDTDGVFYYIDLSTKKPAYDYISTSGKAVLMYENHIQSIHNACQALLPPSSVSDYSLYKDDVGNAISQFLTQLEYYYDEKPSGYYHDESSHKYFYYKDDNLVISYSPPLAVRMRPLIFAIPAGIISAIIFYFATKSRYKFKASANPVAYVSHEETQFIQKDDRFIRTYTTKTKIETNSGGSHGGGGHSHSGGHGGGGSHR